jgi:hypoxanthine phosphoribosyltransferase
MNLFKKHIVTLARLESCCSEIADTVRTFKPDYIVSIESGGWYVGHLLQAHLCVPHYTITIRRRINLQNLYRPFPLQLRIIPSVWQGILFFFKSPVLQEPLLPPTETLLAGKRVLLVDDAVHSGKTLSVAIEYLRSIGAVHIKTAVISNVYGDPIANYYCYSGLYFFPWSRPSDEYPAYLSLRQHLVARI